MKITAPYNFVPLNGEVFYPDWAEQVTQDLPFSDSEDGVIEVKLKNVSPLFTRDGSLEHFSAHIMGADGKRHYFIPATTIKGMLREIVEIISFGKMQEDKDYQNRTFGYRDVANRMDKSKSIEYLKKVNNGRPGWLSQKGDNYYFTPCIGEVEKINTSEVKQKFSGYKPDGSIWKTNVSVASDENKYPIYPEIEHNGYYYQLVCTGDINKKAHELLFPSDKEEAIELAPETIKAFKSMYDATPGFAKEKDGKGCFLMALEKGKEIPVFYLKLPNGQVTLGLSRMFKLPFKYNVRQQVEVLQKAEVNRRDLGELLFGYTSKEASLKGRVQISHAFMEGSVEDSELVETKGILGTPKASYYPTYLKQKKSPYKTYDELEGIAGRKLYRIHSKGTTTQLPQGENKNVGTIFKAIPAGQIFTLRISLHNVKETEIGAILSALSFNLTEGVFFNLGMAKSFGFGKCHIDKDEIVLRGFRHNPQYYMHNFEKMMSVFTYENYQQMWAQTESITQLANILSEHTDEEVRMMPMEDYGESKFEKRNPFSPLKESGYPIRSLLSNSEKEGIKESAAKAKGERVGKEARMKLSLKYQEAKQLIDKGEYQSAKHIYNAIADMLLKQGISCDDENKAIEDLDAKIANANAEKQRILDEKAKDELKAKLEAGLGAILDKMAGDGNTYSIKEFKVCFQKVDKWLKDSKSEKLSESDATAVINTAKRLLENPAKKESKELDKAFDKGNIWCKLAKYLGSDTAKELYDSYQN